MIAAWLIQVSVSLQAKAVLRGQTIARRATGKERLNHKGLWALFTLAALQSVRHLSMRQRRQKFLLPEAGDSLQPSDPFRRRCRLLVNSLPTLPASPVHQKDNFFSLAECKIPKGKRWCLRKVHCRILIFSRSQVPWVSHRRSRAPLVHR